jgi:hypothetical protein
MTETSTAFPAPYAKGETVSIGRHEALGQGN